ncbi:hypothetical protein [Pseudonocardia ailaonensis]|uniref:hypothetical protein n=1 Tax=Pseudonocardia ailaonensis TaxID=367279 RepID=UPI0031D29F80
MTSLPVPARIVLAPHRPLLDRGGTARQFGLAPTAAPVAEDLPPPLVGLLERLVAPAVTLDWMAEAVARGAPVATVNSLLEELVAAGALVDPGCAERRELRRATALVEVRGDGPLAAGVAVALARAGVGAVHVRARGEVTGADVGCGYLAADVGRPRAEAAAGAVARIGADTRGSVAPPGRRPDLVVLTDAVAPEPEVLDELLGEGIDHLSVMVREGTGVVGPLVLVRRSPCLRCVERGRAELDDRWPVLAAQLAGRSGSADPEAVAATAALGAAQALLALDGGEAGGEPPPTVGGALELDPYRGTLRRREWPAHPGCHCGVHEVAARAAAAGGWPVGSAGGATVPAPRSGTADMPVAARPQDATCAGRPGRETIMG